MNITTESGKETKVKLSGQLDTLAAADFDREMQQILTEDVNTLVLDGADLTYVSSAGLRSLLILHKSMMAKGGTFRLRNVKDQIMEIFNITGFSSILNIE